MATLATSHMRSESQAVLSSLSRRNCFLASKLRLLFSNPQAATTHVNEFSESHSKHKSIEGMRTSCSPNINEVSVQVKYKNKRYISRYDIHVNLCQQNLRRRSRAVSRIPTIQIKRLLQLKCINMSEKLFHSHESFMYSYAKKEVLIIS